MANAQNFNKGITGIRDGQNTPDWEINQYGNAKFTRLDGAAGNLAISGTLSIGTNPATAGVIRIPTAQVITARNNANSGNIEMVQVNTTDQVQIGGIGSELRLVGSVILLNAQSTGASTPSNFTADSYIELKDAAGNSFFIAGRAAAW